MHIHNAVTFPSIFIDSLAQDSRQLYNKLETAVRTKKFIQLSSSVCVCVCVCVINRDCTQYQDSCMIFLVLTAVSSLLYSCLELGI